MNNAADLCADKGSFRDRNNAVYHIDNRILRGISEEALDNWRCLADKRFFNSYCESGHLVQTHLLTVEEQRELNSLQDTTWAAYLEHQRIPFINYAYEWCFDMLKDAALLHLDLLDAALREGMIIKDSSHFNVQFVGTNPVFIDIPSFEAYQAGTPWIGFRQFCQHFLYPLMLQAYKRVPFRSWLRGNTEGISPEECNRLLSFRDMLRPGVFSLVYLQSKLVASMGDVKHSMVNEARESAFGKEIIVANIKKLRRTLCRLDWEAPRSEWSEYKDEHSYDTESFAKKSAFVDRIVQGTPRNLAWDIGCNTGHFSKILARNTDWVIAMDRDDLSIQRLYSELKTQANNNILPLVLDIANPSPPLGWRCAERRSLAERTSPDLILCLALVHHLVITNNIPLQHILEWLASFNCDVVMEMIDKTDGMVQKLLLNKTDQYNEFTIAGFESIADQNFVIREKSEVVPSRRFLYHLVPKRG